MSEPVLAAPDLDKKMRVEANASAYISKSLSDTEKNYEIHDKEMLAVIRCLEAWRHFLEGTRIKFEVWTDNKNLEYFMSS